MTRPVWPGDVVEAEAAGSGRSESGRIRQGIRRSEGSGTEGSEATLRRGTVLGCEGPEAGVKGKGARGGRQRSAAARSARRVRVLQKPASRNTQQRSGETGNPEPWIWKSGNAALEATPTQARRALDGGLTEGAAGIRGGMGLPGWENEDRKEEEPPSGEKERLGPQTWGPGSRPQSGRGPLGPYRLH